MKTYIIGEDQILLLQKMADQADATLLESTIIDMFPKVFEKPKTKVYGNTVTSQLRKAIAEVNPNHEITNIFSDTRKNKTAVGVKICGKPFRKWELHLISTRMKAEGFEEISIKRNLGNPRGYCGTYFSGTRFTYYKK